MTDCLNKTLDVLDRLDVEGATPLEVMAEALEDFGLTAVVMFRQPPQSGEPAHVMFSNLPSEWRLRYHEAGYDRIDPLTPTAIAAAHPFSWDELPAHLFDGPAESMFREAAAFRLKKGFCVPVKGLSGAGAVSMAGDDPDLPRPARRMIQMMVTRAFDQVSRTSGPSDLSLSAREKDVLSWTAAGKTAEETGVILGISSLTVSEHLKRVRRRLQTSNTPHTIVTALKLGLIVL